jgi:glycosyltransferase involved in cell wall biosynthesis
MKVLQLCSKPPKPAIDGGCIAMNNFSEGILQLGYDLKILAISTDKHPFLPQYLSEDYLKKTHIESVYIDTRVNLVDAFSSLITQDNYNISRFFSVDFDLVLKRLLSKKKFDLVQLESLFMTPYLATIKRHSKAKVVLRSHNLEFYIWQRLAKQETSRPKKIYLNYLAAQLKRYEMEVMNQLDGVIAISNTDKDKYLHLGCTTPMTTIPLGIDIDQYPVINTKHERPVLFHIGAMDWSPNQEGMNWFLDEIWPVVLKHQPNALLRLAGKELDFFKNRLKGKLQNVEVLGEVDNARDFIGKNDIMIVPLLSGGGIRIKIIEGMAMAKTVISTKVGAEGIDAKNGKQILVAGDAKEFAAHIIKCMEDPQLCTNIGLNARKFTEAHFSFEVINKEVDRFYRQVLGS